MFYTVFKGMKEHLDLFIFGFVCLFFFKSHTWNPLNNKTKMEALKKRVSKLLTSQNKLEICVIANDSTDRGPERL